MENIMSSKLFTTRQGTVLLGVIAALIAAVALIVYLNHYRNSVAQPDVNVLVANKTIPQGMTGGDLAKATGFYVLRGIPKDQVLTGAITDTSTLTKLLFQDMEVMNAVDGGNVTLKATARQAGQLIYASSNTQIWLTLRPTLGTVTKRPPVISANAVTGG